MRWTGCAAAYVAAVSAGPALAQQVLTPELAQRDVKVSVESGQVANPGPTRAVTWTTDVHVDEATWLRLTFDQVTLGAAPDGTPSLLRITSLADGASQTHTQETLAQWQYTSAYFNGDAVRLELIAPPMAAASSLAMSSLWAGEFVPGGTTATICGPTDDRVLSDDDRAARALPIGCTVWLINDAQNCFLTAGHCSTTSLQVIQFNVPLSDGSGNLQHPPPQDQYMVDVTSKQSVNGGVGNDWGYFGCFDNTETGLPPGEAQGVFYTVAGNPPPVGGQNIRITGYGVDSSPSEWNQVQQTHAGPYFDFAGTTLQYQADTQGGNSGSAVVDDSTGLAIGIHTHGGCNSTGGANNGTGINHGGVQSALASPQGVCIPAPLLAFDFPDGLPATLNPSGDTIRVEVLGANGGTPQPGTGVLHYDAGGGFVPVPMQVVSPNVYDAVFPSLTCGGQVLYYFSAMTDANEQYTSPILAPAQSHSALAASGISTTFDDDFEADQGWTVTNGPGLIDGVWQRGVPISNAVCNRGNPGSDADGSGQCYLTANDSADACNSDVDEGSTTLTSPLMDADEPGGFAVISYDRWFSNTQGSSPNQDVFVLEISDDGGSSWTTLEVVGPAGPEANGGWYQKQFTVADFVNPTDQVVIRFTASDTDPQSVVEAAVDGIAMTIVQCGPECPGDLDGDGTVGTSDLLALLAVWGPAPGHPADLDGDDIVGTADLLALLAAWGACLLPP